jgi:ATP-dependent Clp protease ATP-binding subunit ClpA
MSPWLEQQFDEAVAAAERLLPTAAFQRVMQRAVSHAEQMGKQEVTGDNVMVAIFAERESPAVRLLYSQNMTAQDAADFVGRGIIKGSGTAR